MLIASSANNNLYDIAVDTMVLDGNMVLWLHVKAQKWPSHITGEYPILINYDMTGHYPILAGYNQHGTALYIAAVKSEYIYYFTCVEGCARTARYTDITGDMHETDEFFVLALRHDPTDVTPPPTLISPKQLWTKQVRHIGLDFGRRRIPIIPQHRIPPSRMTDIWRRS